MELCKILRRVFVGRCRAVPGNSAVLWGSHGILQGFVVVLAGY